MKKIGDDVVLKTGETYTFTATRDMKIRIGEVCKRGRPARAKAAPAPVAVDPAPAQQGGPVL